MMTFKMSQSISVNQAKNKAKITHSEVQRMRKRSRRGNALVNRKVC